jgi:hypothetical protein
MKAHFSQTQAQRSNALKLPPVNKSSVLTKLILPRRLILVTTNGFGF